jgi:alpha-1,6-mannosyltransferase
VRVVQLANFVSPTSGGIRTVLDRLRAGYAAAGHEPVLVVPGPRDEVEGHPHGDVVRVAAPRIPGTGGYRLILDVGRVRRLLDGLAPDRVEVHDRATLRAAGTWARAHGTPAAVVVHERLDRLAALHLPWVVRPAQAARRDDAAVAARFDAVVAPSRWAAAGFGAGGAEVRVVPWGVELDRFTPGRRSAVLRRRLLAGAQVLVVLVCRLSPEKRPEVAVDGLAALRARGVDARLVVAGTGAAAAAVRRRAAGHPVTFLGHVASRDDVADLLAAADVAVCPGPVETFGLAALEALASGTPVVAARSGAVAELLDDACGRAVYGRGGAVAAAVTSLLAEGQAARGAARAAAERHPWSRAVDRMLGLHGLVPRPVG